MTTILLLAASIPVVVKLLSQAIERGSRSRPLVLLGGLASIVVAWAMLWIDCHPRTLALFAASLCLSSTLLPGEQARLVTARLRFLGFETYFLAVASTSLLIYIHLPLAIYLSSPSEIGLAASFLVTNNLQHAMTGVYLASLLYAFALSPRMRSVLTLLAVVVYLVVALYSFLIPMGYPPMNGLVFESVPIDWLTLVGRGFFDIIVILGSTAATLVFSNAVGKRRTVMLLVLLNASLLVATGVRASGTVPSSLPEKSTEDQRPLRFSRDDNNVLILMLDRLMGSFIEDLFERQPELGSRFDGFTWYPRTISSGQTTIAGIHPILGGYDYTPDSMNRRGEDLRELSLEAYALLPMNFIQSGYQATLFRPRGLGFTPRGDCDALEVPGLHCAQLPEHLSSRNVADSGLPISEISRSNYADLLTLLTLMRATPFVVKNTVHVRGPWRPFLNHAARETFREWSALKSLPQLSNPDDPHRNLNIVWNLLPHKPEFVGTDCLPAARPLTFSTELGEAQGFRNLRTLQHFVAARCSMRFVADYFDWMKRVGVYDSTTIVIVSDHGIMDGVEDHSQRAVAGGTTRNQFVSSRSALLVKPSGARGPVQISERFVPNAEVPQIVCQEIGGCTNPFLGNRPIATDGRSDPFLVSFVPWQFDRQNQTSFVIERQFEVTGRDPFDVRNWTESSKSR